MNAATSVDDPRRSDLMARLDRLEGYLRDDPCNGTLLADAFDTALAAGAFERADFHRRHAEALDLDRPAWAWRAARAAMAARRFDAARATLLGLAGDPAFARGPAAAALAHDLALAELRLGDAVGGITRLAPWMDPAAGDAGRESDGASGAAIDARPGTETATAAASASGTDAGTTRGSTTAAAPDAALDTLWLRLLHHAGDFDRAMAWIAGRESGAGPLGARAIGVASLLALDAGDAAASLAWADRSLAAATAEAPPPPEALVARASLALGERDAARARSLAGQAVAAHPADGRSWSALAFAELLDGRLAAAREAFERAVTAMPAHVGTWHGLGWTGIAARDLPLAGRAFDAALALDRNFAESWGGHAVVQVLAGEREAARGSIGRALGLDRASLAARYAEALLSGDARDADSLHRLAERLLAGRQAPLGGDILALLKRGR